MKFNREKFIKEALVEIKDQVGNKRAVCALSGGVDSTTCAVLTHRVLGKNLTTVFIDDGLMREQDEDEVLLMGRQMGVSIKVIRAAKRFFKALKSEVDPEEKRISFRECFYRTLAEIVKNEKANFLIQGTIAADIKETKEGIKTQHNVLSQVGINPKKYGFEVIEPLRNLYKPEVRMIAKSLGLSEKIFGRMPFPGPGLALRVIGNVTPERIKIVREATAIVEEKLERFLPFQCFAVLLSDKATGIRGKKRAFGNIIVIRSVDSEDAMTAWPTKIPLKILFDLQKKICQNLVSVTKVLYDLTPKPPSTIEYI